MVRRVSRKNSRSKRVRTKGSKSLRKRVRSKSLRKLRRRRSRRMRGGTQEKGGDCSPNLSISNDKKLICRKGTWGMRLASGKAQPRDMSNEERARLEARAATAKQARDIAHKKRGDLDQAINNQILDAGLYENVNLMNP